MLLILSYCWRTSPCMILCETIYRAYNYVDTHQKKKKKNRHIVFPIDLFVLVHHFIYFYILQSPVVKNMGSGAMLSELESQPCHFINCMILGKSLNLSVSDFLCKVEIKIVPFTKDIHEDSVS